MTDAGNRYDEIGQTYAVTRRADPRIGAIVLDALGDATSVVNVGAGTGNYEPTDRPVLAIEPSAAMLAQRPPASAPVVCSAAEHLPLPARSFDAALAILTIHHWSDLDQGLNELQRVADRQVVFYFEPLSSHEYWAIRYFPEALALETEHSAPGLDAISKVLDVREIRTVSIPADCTDGFGAAFWARPDAYLDPDVQAGMSWLAMLEPGARKRGSDRLRRDLESGEWERANGHLRDESEFDGGYRIAVCGV